MRHLIRRTSVFGLALSGVVLAALPAGTFAKRYPEPSVYPISWELKFKHSKPHRIIVDVPGRSTPAAYWYLTYTVTNDTGQDRTFLPSFDLVTEDGKVHHSDMGIPLAVFAAIRKREGNDQLKPLNKLDGSTLRQGEDQAQDGVAIWEEPSSSMRAFTIYVGGLSGEFVIMKDDSGQPMKEADGSPVILRKTLQLDYALRGGGSAVPDEDQIEAKPEKWVMR